MGRRYRRRRPTSSGVIGDSLFIFSRVSWQAAFVLTLLFSGVFFFLIPSWLLAHGEAHSGNQYFEVFSAILAKRIHWSQWIGTAIFIGGCYFTVRNYLVHERASGLERGLVGFLARWFGRD